MGRKQYLQERSLDTESAELSTTHAIDLPYEIDMLRAAYRLLPEYGQGDPHLKNLIIEGFWLHARNLIEMFLGKCNATRPRLVAGEEYAPWEPVQLRTWYSLICNQITHLQNGRPVDDGKLDARDPNFVRLIEAEIANFKAHLSASLQSIFDSLPPPMIPDLRVSGPRGRLQ
jgi:hypothetical protein